MVFLSTTKNSILNHPIFSLLHLCQHTRQFKQIHAQIITSGGLCQQRFAGKILPSLALSDSSNLDYSGKLFDQLDHPTLFLFNTMIRAYSKSRHPNGAIAVFNKMLLVGVLPDFLTFPFVVKSCSHLSSLNLGMSVHSHITKDGLELDCYVQNSLIHLYSSCGDIRSARQVFDGIPQRNLVSWNTMVDGYAKCNDLISARSMFEQMPVRDVITWSALIAGYVHGENHREALATFDRMLIVGPKPNVVTMVSVLCACAHLGALDQGRRMHAYLEDNGLGLTLVICTSLVDMYAKCGAIEEALHVFRQVPPNRTDLLLWNAMIAGFAMHGLSQESLDLFREMQAHGIRPDEITYLGLLSACAHGGLVSDAWFFFKSLDDFGMTPKIEHYSCMVDVLGRAGLLDEAYGFLNKIPVEPTASMLGALLNGCRIHKRVDLGELIGKWLIELEPNHDGRYIGLSNVYAGASQWNDARKMREMMEKRGVKKVPGYSSIEVNGLLHRFIAHDKAHPQSEVVHLILDDLAKQMKLEDHFQTQYLDFYDTVQKG